jgi:hypothetical protein
MIAQTMKAEGVTEDLKARDAMEWIRRVNSIRARVEETIRAELIYIRPPRKLDKGKNWSYNDSGLRK